MRTSYYYYENNTIFDREEYYKESSQEIYVYRSNKDVILYNNLKWEKLTTSNSKGK